MDWNSEYTIEEATGVRVRTGRQVAHDYSDGVAAEAYILESIQSCRDVSSGSDELVRCMRDWPSEYHFSASRPTLLAPFDFLGLRVLEVGCGCGALTRHLGESGASVVALEGSLDRARITSARCRGLRDVDVVCDDFRDFIAPDSFDFVLMVGVLEYAPCYFSGSDPVGEALDAARSHLAENGALILAIENQLGLKYFAGCVEDHSTQAYFGIEDRYRDAGGPITFGRTELRRRLSAAGFLGMDFYYPFPDYKLPKLLLTERSLEEPLLHAGRLAGGLRTRDYSWPHPHVFAEDAAWEVIDRNLLVSEFANSYLVAASPRKESPRRQAPEWLAELRSTDRVRAFRTVTQFLAHGDDLSVLKTRADEHAAQPSDSPAGLLLPMESPFIHGSTLGSRVRRLLRSPTSTTGDVAGALRPWVRLLREATIASAASTLPGTLLDMVPWNAMEPDDTPALSDRPDYLVPFDLEWEYRGELELDHVVYRGLASLLATARGEMHFDEAITVGDVLLDIATRLGSFGTRSSLQDLVARESIIQSSVFGIDQEATFERMIAELEEPAGGKNHREISMASRDARLRDLTQHAADQEVRIGQLSRHASDQEVRIGQLVEQVAELRTVLGEAYAQLAAVEASASWRVTAPLRRLRGGSKDAGR